MKIVVNLTGADHNPTELNKWYAQVQLKTYDEIPVGCCSYAFGQDPIEALTNLVKRLRDYQVNV